MQAQATDSPRVCPVCRKPLNTGKKYCGLECWYKYRRSTEIAFWPHVQKTDNCWLWTGRKDGKGYGQLKVRGRRTGAHRVSWEIHNGPIPEGLHCLHKCDNPPCVNPEHLFIGTQDDNLKDMIRKGRSAKGQRNGMLKHPDRQARGEQLPQAKLRAEQVLLIREQAAKGKSDAELAKQFNVNRAAITYIRLGRTWKHIGGPLTRRRAT